MPNKNSLPCPCPHCPSLYFSWFLFVYVSIFKFIYLLHFLHQVTEVIDKLIVKILLEEGIIRKKGLGESWGTSFQPWWSLSDLGGRTRVPGCAGKHQGSSWPLRRQCVSVKGSTFLSHGSLMRGNLFQHTLFSFFFTASKNFYLMWHFPSQYSWECLLYIASDYESTLWWHLFL